MARLARADSFPVPSVTCDADGYYRIKAMMTPCISEIERYRYPMWPDTFAEFTEKRRSEERSWKQRGCLVMKVLVDAASLLAFCADRHISVTPAAAQSYATSRAYPRFSNAAPSAPGAELTHAPTLQAEPPQVEPPSKAAPRLKVAV
jgi:hypothetical protein